MARLRKDENDFQELVPRIPNQITIQHIATKLTWEPCDVMRAVSQGWHRAVGNRSVYDARVLSNSTEPFLFILWETDGSGEPGLTLFSCKRFSCLRLPPIPVTSRKVTSENVDEKIKAICLFGRVYVWVRTDVDDCGDESPCKWEEICTCVLDLGGDRRWTVCKPKRYPYSSGRGLGVLNGKMYRFQGSYLKHTTLEKGPETANFNEPASTDDKRLPTTEVYDPLSDVWSCITPKPIFEHQFVKDYLPSLYEWASAQRAVDASKSFLTNGRYEPFFSEWRRGQSADSSAASAVDDPRRSEVATQVYCKNVIEGSKPFGCREHLFFMGGRLLTFIKWLRDDPNDPGEDDPGHTVHLDLYDIKEKRWKEYSRFLSVSDDAREECEEYEEEGFKLVHFAAIDNVIWAVMGTGNGVDRTLRFCLIRTPVLQYNHDEDFGNLRESHKFRSHQWIDNVCSLSKDFLDARPGQYRGRMHCRYSRRVLMLRPVYL